MQCAALPAPEPVRIPWASDQAVYALLGGGGRPARGGDRADDRAGGDRGGHTGDGAYYAYPTPPAPVVTRQPVYTPVYTPPPPPAAPPPPRPDPATARNAAPAPTSTPAPTPAPAVTWPIGRRALTDLEAAADVVDNQLLELAQKKHHMKVDFSNDGWKDLKDLHHAVTQIAQMSIACFQTQDKDLAAKVVFHKRNIRKLEHKMREAHMSRLVRGTPESVMTSSIHLDVLGEYRRIVGLLSNHVYSLLKDSDPYGLLPRRE